MNKLVIHVAAGAMLLGACAAPQTDIDADMAPLSDAEALGAMMTDIFETAPDDPDNDIRDRRVRIESPDFSGVWLYYQLNTGPEKQVYRQRVIELINQDGVVVQKTYGLKDPDMFVDAWDKPTLLSSMSLSDIEPFFDEGCEQVWRRAQDAWRGAVNRETCRIFSARRQAHIFIEAEARLDETTYKQTERGYDEDGEKLFGGEPGEFIVLYRK